MSEISEAQLKWGTWVLALLLAGCAERTTRPARPNMPNPEGCFVQVWDHVQHRGMTDYLNGPRALLNLRDLPGRRTWEDRIHSFRTGVTARVTVYVEEDFRGQGFPLMANTAYPMLSERLSGRIKSMNIDCEGSALPKVQSHGR
jgi:hypothetical protein